MFSDHSGIKLKINHEKIIRNVLKYLEIKQYASK